jgi:proteasome lid subunit RPN8/RPN11
LRIARDLLEQVVAHARAEAPNECCGMIAATDGRAVSVHPATNRAASPLRYEIAPREQFDLLNAIEERGLELGAIYHSHTRSDPVPSQTDINLAFFPGTTLPCYPGTVYVIVGLKGPEPDVRGWWMRDGGYEPAELRVEDS